MITTKKTVKFFFYCPQKNLTQTSQESCYTELTLRSEISELDSHYGAILRELWICDHSHESPPSDRLFERHRKNVANSRLFVHLSVVTNFSCCFYWSSCRQTSQICEWRPMTWNAWRLTRLTFCSTFYQSHAGQLHPINPRNIRNESDKKQALQLPDVVCINWLPHGLVPSIPDSVKASPLLTNCRSFETVRQRIYVLCVCH